MESSPIWAPREVRKKHPVIKGKTKFKENFNLVSVVITVAGFIN
tara:strand:+ start:296 stop:427 length:132 start_codon:yes stop_codon:yes gene_type:complete